MKKKAPTGGSSETSKTKTLKPKKKEDSVGATAGSGSEKTRALKPKKKEGSVSGTADSEDAAKPKKKSSAGSSKSKQKISSQ